MCLRPTTGAVKARKNFLRSLTEAVTAANLTVASGTASVKASEKKKEKKKKERLDLHSKERDSGREGGKRTEATLKAQA